MPVETHKVDIKSQRNGSGWVIEVSKKGGNFYISAKEYLLPHDLEMKLDNFLDSQAATIKNIFNVSISVCISNQKIESRDKAIEFIKYINNSIQTENFQST